MDLIIAFLAGFIVPFIVDFIPNCHCELNINERNRNA